MRAGAELAIAVRSAELVLVGDHWRSRLAALCSAIAGEGDSLLSCCKRVSNCNCSQSRVRVTLHLTVSQSVRLGVEPRLGLMTRYIFLYESCCPVYMGRPL
jgi:hypothetical protein